MDLNLLLILVAAAFVLAVAYAAVNYLLVRRLRHLFGAKDEWQLAADLTRHVLEETGTLFGIALSGDLSKKTDG